jgi:hypothetical protein
MNVSFGSYTFLNSPPANELRANVRSPLKWTKSQIGKGFQSVTLREGKPTTGFAF